MLEGGRRGPLRSLRREEVREVVLGRDRPTDQPEAQGLRGEYLDLGAILLESVRVEIVPHYGGRVLELGLEPRRRVREALLRRGEALVGRDERFGEAPRDPAVRLPDLAPDNDEVLRGKRPRSAEVVLLDGAELREEPDEPPGRGVVGLRPRRAVDRLELAGPQHVRERPAGWRRVDARRQRNVHRRRPGRVDVADPPLDGRRIDADEAQEVPIPD